MAGKLQKEDFKTEAEIIAAGGAKSQLLNDTQIYVTANSVNKTLDDAIIDGDIGSGGGAVPNYITNGDAETNTTGWSLFDDGAVSVPVNGTGGSSSTLTLTRTTTSGEILSGAASFKLAKSAADGQGEGVSYDFTVDRSGATTPTKISFNYQTTANFSYTNKDLVVYIYDVTASALIQPTPYYLDGSGKFVGEFQTNANTSTSYRLIFMVATTNATAYDFIFDNVVVYPNQNQAMTLLQDKEYDISSYVVNSANVTAVLRAVAVPYKTKDGTWRMRFNIQVTQSSNSYCVFTITGITLNSSFSNTTGQAFATNPNAGYTGAGYAYSTNTFTLNVNGSSSATQQTASGDVELASMPTWAVDYYPVSLSDGAETRVVAMSAYGGSANTYTGGSLQTIIFNTEYYDTHSAYDTSTAIYTVPVSGYYHMHGSIKFNNPTAVSTIVAVVKNNSVYQYVAQTTLVNNNLISYSLTVKCEVNDTLQIQANPQGGSYSTDTGVQGTNLSIERVSGPATVAASEKVAARYSTSVGQSINSSTIIDYATKDFDTHNAVTTGGSWKFTSPSTGYYRVSAMVGTASAAWTAGQGLYAELRKNGSLSFYLNRLQVTASYTDEVFISGTGSIYLSAGDYIDLRGTADRGATNLKTSGSFNWISIEKI